MFILGMILLAHGRTALNSSSDRWRTRRAAGGGFKSAPRLVPQSLEKNWLRTGFPYGYLNKSNNGNYILECI